MCHLTFTAATAMLPLLLVVLIGAALPAGSQKADTMHGHSSAQCSAMLGAFSAAHPREPAALNGDGTQIVYFLHVPRTAGRTFHNCFLKMGTHPSRRCPRAYDHLRINTSLPNCYLLSSHDDFSVVSMLPEDAVVLTHLRDPVDRFLSAYEFAIEVAAKMAGRPADFKKRDDRIATEDVWPWSHLVPWFMRGMKARMARVRAQPMPEQGNWIHVEHPDGDQFYYNKVLGYSKWELDEHEREQLLPPLNPYDNPLVMPLAQFVDHPLARDLLHNGQLFQVLGLTNYSHYGDADSLRRCFWESPQLQAELLESAKARLRRFVHVGVTDRLADSVAAAGAALGLSLTGDAWAGTEDAAPAPPAVPTHTRPHDGPSVVSAADIPHIADRVRAARLELQSAQRQLFRAAQFHMGSDEMARLKREVTAAREELARAQELLLQARAQLPTAIEPEAQAEQQRADVALGASRAAAEAGTNRKLPMSLGMEYQRCASRAQQRNLQRKDNALLTVSMPDGRYVRFNKASRKMIPPEVIDRIRQLNQADTELHRLGTDILEANMAAWKADGRWEDLPPPPDRVAPYNLRSRWSIPKPSLLNSGQLHHSYGDLLR